jgi:hypothetical protein
MAAKQLPTGELNVAEERRPIPYRNLAVGAVMNVFQGKFKSSPNLHRQKSLTGAPVTTLGQPMEVLKTHVCATIAWKSSSRSS